MIRASAYFTLEDMPGLSAEFSSMSPLHVALSDAPEKQLATIWTVEGFSILCFIACIWSYVLLLLEDQNLFISTDNGVSELCSSFRLELLLDGDFFLNLSWNPEHKNQTLNPAFVAPEQPQRHSLGTVHKIFQKSEYPLFLSF
jgi:hypothetical protein